MDPPHGTPPPAEPATAEPGARPPAPAGGTRDTEAAILAAATRLFAARGFAGTSVAEVVAAARVTKGALYHYYRSKDELLHAVYARVLVEQTERLAAIAAGGQPADVRLRAAAVDVVESSAAHLTELTVFVREWHRLSAETTSAVRAERRAYHERFRALVEEGQREGALRPDLDAELVTAAFFGSVHHLTTWFRPEGPRSAREVGETFAELLVAGLRPV